MAKRILTLLMVACGQFAIVGCATETTVPAGDPAVIAPADGGMAVVHYESVDLTRDDQIASFARAEIVVLESAYLWSDSRNQDGVAAMKALNPDCRVIGYVNAHGSWLAWGDDPETDFRSRSYTGDWYQATRPYWSYTTTGDTMISWPGKVLLNILDPDCREAMVQVLVDHWELHSNVLDGIFWDHFNPYLWVLDAVSGRTGEMDLDGDGVPHRQDEDEMAAYREASEALILRARQVLGDHVIQVANGMRAATDSSFAGLLDGMMYENFPEVGFWGENMRQALDPTVYNNLFAARNWPRRANGGPWLILSNKFLVLVQDADLQLQTVRLADFARVAALLTDNYVSYHGPDQTTSFGWPDIELDLGPPQGEAVWEGAFLRRTFERGAISLEMTAGDMPLPFNYTISSLETVVQEFSRD